MNKNNRVVIKDNTNQKLVQVISFGPQGIQGSTGPQGPQGPGIDTGSFATTGSNVFIGDQTITGSLLVSGSSTFTNIGPAIFSGSVEITGGLTASVASSSFATTAQTSSNSAITHGVTDNNQYLTTIANSTDAVQPIQRPTAPILYSPSTTNPITNASDKAAEFQLGLNNQAGGIFLTSNLLSDNPNYIRTLNQDLYLKVKSAGTGKLIISASAGIETTGHITASGNISASGEMVANSLRVENRASGITADVIISGSTFDGDSRDAQIIYPSHGLHFNDDSGNNNHVLALASNNVGIRIQPDSGNTALTVSGSINVIDGDIFGVTNITASGNISASGDIVTNALTASGLIYPTVDGVDGSVIVSDGLGNLSMGHGERLVVQVRNNESFTITAGTPLHAVGSIGGSLRVLVVTASADSSYSDTMPAFGIAATDLTPTGGTKDGYAVTTGIFPDYNITLASGSITVEEGQILYVGQNGGLTNVKPDTNDQNLIQNVGIVLKTNGTLVQNLQVSAINRTNDVPNLNQGNIFFGSGSNYAKIHISGALDQTIINNITASGDISASGQFIGDGSGLTNLQRPITTHTADFSASAVYAGNFNIVGGSLTCSISTSAAAVGAEWEFFQTSSAGNFLFETGSGITLYSKDGNIKLAGQSSAATLKKISADSFALIGDLTS